MNEITKQLFRTLRRTLKPGINELEDWLTELTPELLSLLIAYIGELLTKKKDQPNAS